MFLSPATSLKQYKINGTSLIIIGESHVLDNGSSDKVKTWDFLNKKLEGGDVVHMEIHPYFKKGGEKYIKDLVNATNSMNIKMFLGDKKNLDNIEGVDYRRLEDFFGPFEKIKLQQAFFYMDFEKLEKIPIGTFMKVIDNIMIFINNHFYGQMRKHISDLNREV